MDKIKNPKPGKIEALTIAMLLGAAAAILFSYFTAFSAECEKVQNEVFRLHILANSNLDADQQLKYDLRDALMQYTEECFKDAKTASQAKEAAEKNLEGFERLANDFIASQGFSYKAKAQVSNIYFTTRRYGTYTLPAGRYDALRITIGEGGGKNWWCVMYPPLCLPACDGSEPLFNPESSKAIEEGEGIEIKFAVYEMIRGITDKKQK